MANGRINKSLVGDHALNVVFLSFTEQASITFVASTKGRANTCLPSSIEQIDRCTHCRMNQSGHCHDLHDLDAFLVQPNDLLAQLMQLLPYLIPNPHISRI